MKKLIIASIFLVPLASIIPMPGTILWYPQVLMLITIGLICLSSIFWKMNKFITLLLVYETFSYIFITQQSFRCLLCLIIGFSGIFIAYIVSKLEDTKILYKCIIGMAILQFIYVIFQSFNIDVFFHNETKIVDIVGLVGSYNQLGIYYSSIGAILASFNPFLLIFSIVPIFLAKQNGAMLGLISGLLVYSYFAWSKKVAIGLFVIILLLAIPWFKYTERSNSELMERFKIWKLSITQVTEGYAIETKGNVIKSITCNPLTGFGFSNFFTISPYTQIGTLPKNTGHVYEHAHNDFVESLFELGYIGMLLILFCIASLIADFIISVSINRNIIVPFCCLISMSVCSLSVYVFHAPVSFYMFCLMLGLFYKEVNNANKSQIKPIT